MKFPMYGSYMRIIKGRIFFVKIFFVQGIKFVQTKSLAVLVLKLLLIFVHVQRATTRKRGFSSDINTRENVV